MEVALTDGQALALVVMTGFLAVVAIACPLRWTLVAVGVSAVGFVAVARSTGAVLSALFVGLLATLVGTIVKERRDATQAALAAELQADLQRTLARDLHDTLAHSLSGLALRLEAARLLAVREGSSALADEMAAAHRLAAQGVEQARIAVAALRGSASPAGSIGALAADHEEMGGGTVQLDEDGDPLAVPVEARLVVFRTVQEALSNARRHGPADGPVSVAVSWGRPTTVTVASRLGEAEPASLPPSGGFGLVGLEERARLAGGSFEAGPIEGGGQWRVAVRLP